MKISNSQKNFQSPEIKKNDKYQNVPKPYMDFAKGQERIFTNHLLKEMRKTAQATEPESTAHKYYKSMMDDELARVMSDSDSGIGIKDIVLDQIYPQYKKVNINAENAYNMNQPKKGVSNE